MQNELQRHARSATLVLGDWNVRFPNLDCQQGRPSVRERIEPCLAWATRFQMHHIQPTHDRPTYRRRGLRWETQLTTDHAFAKARQHKWDLSLINGRSVGFDTDHKYVLYLQERATERSKEDALTLPRYQIRKLNDREVQSTLSRRFHGARDETDRICSEQDVDQIHTSLVEWCQRQCQEILGKQQRKTGHGLQRTREQRREGGPEVQSVGESIRLYKQAVRSSQENGPILPTERARQEGVDVVTEAFQEFSSRYIQQRALAPPPLRLPEDDGELSSWTEQEIQEEVDAQDMSKSVGADGIHIRVVRILVQTLAIRALQHLYQRCLETRTTPQGWNQTDIHLITKDSKLPRTLKNVRPITLITMFRKVFERLLLKRCEGADWAQLHRGQAGFRREYSTLTNAALVHHLLSTRQRDTAVFLDFSSAFDTLDHTCLDERLMERGCPQQVRDILKSLMCKGLSSRVLVNDTVTPWFPRTRGVLQGSPLSPFLFNIYIDPLLVLMNKDESQIPFCLFYADDGVLLPKKGEDLQMQID